MKKSIGKARRTGILSGLVLMAALCLPLAVLAQESVTVQLSAVGDSGVSGTATLTSEGEATQVALEISGLPTGATARATMQAGTCEMPSASFATLPDLEADEAGRASASGYVLFRGSEDVALETMADGEHVVIIQLETAVACGGIPAVQAPTTLPTTGGRIWSVWAALGLAGVLALAVGLGLQSTSRSRRPA